MDFIMKDLRTESKINQIEQWRSALRRRRNIIRFDILMHNPQVMQFFQCAQPLHSDHKHSFEAHALRVWVVLEQAGTDSLQDEEGSGGVQEVRHSYLGGTSASLQSLQYLRFVLEHLVLMLICYDFHRHSVSGV